MRKWKVNLCSELAITVEVTEEELKDAMGEAFEKDDVMDDDLYALAQEKVNDEVDLDNVDWEENGVEDV